MRKFRDQQLRQSKRISQNKGKRHILSVSQLQLLDDKQFSECYANVKDLSTNKSIKSANFYNALFGVWQVEIEGPPVQLELFMNKNKTGPKKIAQATLRQVAQTIYLSSLEINRKKIGILVYKIKQVNESSKDPKVTHPSQSQNIFNIGQDQISRVHSRPAKKSDKRLEQEERVGFHDGISFASSIIDDEEANRNSKISKSSKNENDERKGLYVEDSVVQQILSNLGKSSEMVDESKNEETNKFEKKQKDEVKHEEKEKQNLQKIKENLNQSVDQEELLTTAEKWYQKKFNKKNISKFRKKNYALINAPQNEKTFSKKAIQIVSHNEELIDKQEVVRQLSDISTEQHIKLKTIDFSLSSDEGSLRLYTLSRNDGNSSSLWYTAISIPTKGLISIQCQGEQQYLNGCLGTSQIKKGQCPLYDPEGTIIGNLNFKSRTICNSTAQTHDLLREITNQQMQEDDEKQKQKMKQVEIETQQQNVQNQKDEPKVQKYIQDITEPVDPNNRMNEGNNKQPQRKEDEKNQPLIEEKRQQQLSKPINHQENQVKELLSRRADQSRLFQKQANQQLQERPNSRKSIRKAQTQILQNTPSRRISPEIDFSEEIKRKQGKKSEQKEKVQMNKDQNMKPQRISQVYDRIKKINDKRLESIEEPIEKKTIQKASDQEKDQQGEPHNIQSPTRSKEQQRKFRKSRYAYQSSISPLVNQQHSPKQQGNQNNPTYSEIAFYDDRFRFPPKRREGASMAITNNISAYSQRQRHKYSNGFSYKKGENQNSIIDQYRDDLHQSQRYDKLRRNFTNNQEQEKSFEYAQQTKRGINEAFFKNHRVNFQVKVVEINVSKCNLKPKFTKIQIDNNKFYTQTTNHVYHCRWESEGYIFPSTYQYTKLQISLFQENQDGIVGKCSIPLAYLKLNIPNIDFQYSQYMTNEKMESVGRLHIVYRVIDRKIKTMNYEQNDETYKYLNNQNNMMDEAERKKKKKKRKDKQRYSTEISARIRQSRSIMDSRNRNYPFMDSRSKGSFGLMGRKKYTGGNILIPKASRFVQPNINKIKKNDPGPGSYEMISMFDRHALPY